MVGNRFKGIAAGLVVAGMLAAPASALAKGNRYRNVNRRAAVVQCEAGERVVTERDRVNRRDRVVARCEEDERSKTKTALMIGGGAATGAGVGAVVDGTRGALIGAAIGGGAASIYEAAKRR
jgi:hypothetical protein